jgi:hypothetical protein
MDCFRLRSVSYGGQVVARAPLRKRFAFVAGNDVEKSEYDSAFSRRDTPEVLQETLPSENRGRREDRVRAAPAVSRAKCTQQKRTRAYRFSGNTPAFPAQWFYGLYRALPGVPGFLATIAPREAFASQRT